MIATLLQLMFPSAQNLVYVVSVHLHFVLPCTTQHEVQVQESGE